MGRAAFVVGGGGRRTWGCGGSRDGEVDAAVLVNAYKRQVSRQFGDGAQRGPLVRVGRRVRAAALAVLPARYDAELVPSLFVRPAFCPLGHGKAPLPRNGLGMNAHSTKT